MCAGNRPSGGHVHDDAGHANDGRRLGRGGVKAAQARWIDRDDGRSVYVGNSAPQQTDNFIAVLDSALPERIRNQLLAELPEFMRLFSGKLGALSTRPMLFVSYDASHPNGWGRQGGVLPSQVFIHFYGSKWPAEMEKPGFADDLAWHFAHEAAHLYQRHTSTSPGDDWITEGSAEAFAAMAQHASAFDALGRHPQAFAAMARDPQAFAAYAKDANAFAAAARNPAGIAAMARDANAFQALARDAQAMQALARDAQAFDAMARNADAFQALARNAEALTAAARSAQAFNAQARNADAFNAQAAAAMASMTMANEVWAIESAWISSRVRTLASGRFGLTDQTASSSSRWKPGAPTRVERTA